MTQIVECIPNFSEGRNSALVQALVAAVRSTPDVWLLDRTMDADHHRSVLTFAGPPEAVGEAAYRTIKVATALIDLRGHRGVHPRIGATDVVPFVPLHDVSMEECARLARTLGQKVGAELGIPVFLYEQASRHADRAKLAHIRRGGLQGLSSRMESDPRWLPDFGPGRAHQTAGAIIIGARHPLIAFNVNLNTSDISIAKTIAKAIRQSDGGLPSLNAIGVTLASRGLVQVAMNLTDYRVTSMQTAWQAVKTEASRHGVGIVGSELVGLVPQAALDEAAAVTVQLERFDPRQILESRIQLAMSKGMVGEQSLSEFLEAVANAKPTPAGGSVAALVGALAASLGAMGVRLGDHPGVRRQLLLSSQRLLALVQADLEAYQSVRRVRALPETRPERGTELAVAWRNAIEVPLEIAEIACESGRSIHSCLQTVKTAVRSDLTVAIIMAVAAAEAGLHTAEENAKSKLNSEVNNVLLPRLVTAKRSLEELRGLCYTPPPIVT